MAGYEYDEQGHSLFFFLTFLTFVLVPSSYVTFRKDEGRATAQVKTPTAGWNRKTSQVKRSGPRGPGLKLRHLLLAAGWALFAATAYRATGFRAASATYDPYAILGIKAGAAEKEIKRHFKRLSIKFHPDKLKLAPNQTKEEADAHFVDLTKAYKTLTDEVVRRNFELYGHPDGKQDFGAGIAIPKWVVDSQNNIWVLGLYALLLVVALPYFVGRWWFRSRRRTKDGVLNDTAALFFHQLKEETQRFSQVLEILSSALEFKEAATAKGPGAADDYRKIEAQVIEQLALRSESLDGKLYQQPYAKRTSVLLYAHLFRLPVNDVSLLKEQQATVIRAVQLATSLGNIATAHNWLPAYTLIIGLQQHLVQALHPTLSPLLQLPYLTNEIAAKLYREKNVSTVEELISMSDDERKPYLAELPASEAAEAIEVGKHWPQLEIVSAAFSVTGERVVTPGSIVQLELKVRQKPPRVWGEPAANGSAHAEVVTLSEPGKEMDIDELIGRTKPGALGEEANSFAHAPYLSSNRGPSWQVYVGDHKLDRIFVQPTRFSDIGPTKTRTLRITFQAPQGAGLYTFQTHVRSECYIGTDAQVAMKLRVDPPEALGANAQPIEDEISEPEEDSLAGQMAAMRGQPFKRIDDEDEDDSSEDEDSGWSETTASEDE